MSAVRCSGPSASSPSPSTCAGAAPASPRRRSPSASASRCAPSTATSTRSARRAAARGRARARRRVRARPQLQPAAGELHRARSGAARRARALRHRHAPACPSPRRSSRALDKVRAALSTSAQRELLARLQELAFLGVPALPTQEGRARRASSARGSSSSRCASRTSTRNFIQTHARRAASSPGWSWIVTRRASTPWTSRRASAGISGSTASRTPR